MATWEFATGDASTVKLWSEKVIRDAEKHLFFAPLAYTLKSSKSQRATESSKYKGIIQVHSDLQSQKGDRVTLENVARITGRGVHGDGLLAGTGADLNVYTMNLFIENVAMQVRTAGELSERRVVMDFRETAMPELGSWAGRKLEEAIALALWGLTSWNNSPYDNWSNNGETSVFGNTIQTFDSAHQLYAGDATSNGTIDSGDVLTAQMLTKAETTAFEDLAIPLEPLNIDGEDCLILFVSNRGKEQLLYDQEFREAQSANTRGSSNPMLSGTIGKFGRIWVIPYPKAPNPAANVGSAILCGANALQLAKVKDWEWWEGYEDSMKRRKVIAVGGTFGLASTYLNSTRRNAVAINHYQRS